MGVKDDAILLGVGAVVVYFAARHFFGTGGALNPMNPDNVINRGFESVYQGVTGSTGSLGGDVYDITHDGTLNPASENNIINRGVNSIGRSESGDASWTLGGWIYDITH